MKSQPVTRLSPSRKAVRQALGVFTTPHASQGSPHPFIIPPTPQSTASSKGPAPTFHHAPPSLAPARDPLGRGAQKRGDVRAGAHHEDLNG